MNEREEAFKRELAALVNSYNYDGEFETPDFVLAEYVVTCLRAFNLAKLQAKVFHRVPNPPPHTCIRHSHSTCCTICGGEM